LRTELGEIRKQNAELMEQIDSIEKDRDPGLLASVNDHYPSSTEHVRALRENLLHRVNSHPNILFEYYLLFVLLGESSYSIFQTLLGLPCWRTCLKYKATFLAKSGFSPSIFDGSENSISMLCHLFNIESLSELILVVDAIAIESYVRINSDGSAEGFISSIMLNETGQT
jgi:hypothetical protein